MRRALFFTTSERYLGLNANFATIAVVSRILTPSEIGVSVLAMAIISFALAAREFATTNVLGSKRTHCKCRGVVPPGEYRRRK